MMLRAALLLAAAVLPMTAAECPGMRRVPVYLAVSAPVDAGTIAAAREEAGWVLRSLCAAVDWQEAESADALLIRVLAEPVSAGSTPDALGLAMPNLGRGNRGAVFLGRIRERVDASAGKVGLPILMGNRDCARDWASAAALDRSFLGGRHGGRVREAGDGESSPAASGIHGGRSSGFCWPEAADRRIIALLRAMGR